MIIAIGCLVGFCAAQVVINLELGKMIKDLTKRLEALEHIRDQRIV